MALKKDKEKVLGEVFDDDRVRGFLEPYKREGFNSHYLLLERAYRGMKVENFATFIQFFVDAGHLGGRVAWHQAKEKRTEKRYEVGIRTEIVHTIRS